MWRQRLLTVLVILAIEGWYLLVALNIMSDFGDYTIPYGWITIRLGLVAVGAVLSPIGISWGIHLFDKHMKGQAK